MVKKWLDAEHAERAFLRARLSTVASYGITNQHSFILKEVRDEKNSSLFVHECLTISTLVWLGSGSIAASYWVL